MRSYWRSNIEAGCVLIYPDTEIDDLMYTACLGDPVLTFTEKGNIESGIIIDKKIEHTSECDYLYIIVRYVPSERHPFTSCVLHEQSIERYEFAYGFTFDQLRSSGRR